MNQRTSRIPKQPAANSTSRRAFLAASAAALAGRVMAQQKSQPAIPIIDTHIHFYDTTRVQGVPYPAKGVIPNVPIANPEVFKKVTANLNIVGAIETEASPWIEDNLWVLEICEKDPLMVGYVGDLEPEKPEFREYLERYHRNPLFRGIRCGNIWNRNVVAQVEQAEFIAGIKELAAADLSMDTANPKPDLIHAMVRLTDKVPNLRLIIDHLPGLEPPTERAALQAYEADLRELAKRNVFVKVSVVARRVNGKVPTELAVYKPRLDMIWDIFGENRLIYGSDWPNSAGNWVPYETELALVREFFMAKGHAAAEKYFWKNSVAAYKWKKRAPNQPQA